MNMDNMNIEEEDKKFIDSISNKIFKSFDTNGFDNVSDERVKLSIWCKDNFLGSSFYYMLTGGKNIFDELMEERNENLGNLKIPHCRGFVIDIESPKVQDENDEDVQYIDTDNIVGRIALRVAVDAYEYRDICGIYIHDISSLTKLILKEVIIKFLTEEGGIVNNELR